MLAVDPVFIKIPPCETEAKRKKNKTKYIISRTCTLQLSAILKGLKIMFWGFKFLIEAKHYSSKEKKALQVSSPIQLNIKNKLAVMDPAF